MQSYAVSFFRLRRENIWCVWVLAEEIKMSVLYPAAGSFREKSIHCRLMVTNCLHGTILHTASSILTNRHDWRRPVKQTSFNKASDECLDGNAFRYDLLQFIPRLIGSSGGHEGQFSRDPLPVFLQETIMSSSCMGRDVQSLMLSIQHFLCRHGATHLPRCFEGWFWRGCRGAYRYSGYPESALDVAEHLLLLLLLIQTKKKSFETVNEPQ